MTTGSSLDAVVAFMDRMSMSVKRPRFIVRRLARRTLLDFEAELGDGVSVSMHKEVHDTERLAFRHDAFEMALREMEGDLLKHLATVEDDPT